MKPTDRDAALLWDMLRACRETAEFLEGITRSAFLGDRKLCLAIERCLEIVGEAAGRVSDTLQSRHPEVPWRQLRGMRNILAHDYGEIDHDIIYTTATRDLPALTVALSAIVLKSS